MTEKSNMAAKRMRSAKAPTINAGVMMAKVIWNAKKRISGIVPDNTSASIPMRNALSSPPTKAVPSAKDRLYPNANHTTVADAVIAKHCINTESTFLVRTRPP